MSANFRNNLTTVNSRLNLSLNQPYFIGDK